MKKVLYICSKGTELGELGASLDCLFRAGADIKLAKVKENPDDNEKYVETTQKVKILCDYFLDEVKDNVYDMIVFPGGLPNCLIIGKDKTTIEFAKKHKNLGKWYTAICASPLEIFKKTGISEGEKITWHPLYKPEENKDNTNERVCISNKCITSQGPCTPHEFGFALVEALYGKEKTDELKMIMLFKE